MLRYLIVIVEETSSEVTRKLGRKKYFPNLKQSFKEAIEANNWNWNTEKFVYSKILGFYLAYNNLRISFPSYLSS